MIKVQLNGQGGMLDCRTIEATEDDEKAIRDAVMDIVLNSVLAPGDTIVISEI
jgi:hypothetical protein